MFVLYRSSIMLWFLWELRNTMKYEHSSKKLDFLLHFGASSLVWFIYLPIVAIIATQVSPLWRYKLLLGMSAKHFLHQHPPFRFTAIFASHSLHRYHKLGRLLRLLCDDWPTVAESFWSIFTFG